MRAQSMRSQESIARRVENTVEQQAYVEDAIRIGRPLDAEDDQDRKLAYVAHKVGVSLAVARHIAAGGDLGGLGLAPGQRATAESLQGKSVDFVPVDFLARAQAAVHSVARIVARDGQVLGTGFMVSPSLLLTNHHVISDARDLPELLVEFNYEVDSAQRTAPITVCALAPNLFLFDATDDLDFALVQVTAPLRGPGQLADFGYLPLLDTEDRHIKAEFVNIIQHPHGRPKEIVLRENRIVARTDNTLIYGADTLPGSSGSPVLNDAFEVIALHHWGSPYRAQRDRITDTLPTMGNEGIRISAIVQELRAQRPAVDLALRPLINELLAPAFRHPSRFRPERTAAPRRAWTTNPGEPRSEATPMDDDHQAHWTIPLHVAVRVGGTRSDANPVAPETPFAASSHRAEPTPSSKPMLATSGAGNEALRPDDNFRTRKGYNPKFLGLMVPLPSLSRELQALAARNQTAREGDNPFELKYHHFSVVMNGARRLAFFSAVNIDGSRVVQITRTTGAVRKDEDSGEALGAEGGERWFDDERTDGDERTHQDLYSHSDLSDFQRGHLVKRTDPMWGGVDMAQRAEADTFHFTNCAPQHEGFNPKAARWAGLENWITNGSDDEDLRVTVFTGPIFRPRDPKRGYVRVPLKFWKVVARVEDGELRATAAVADQSALVKGERGGEGLPPLPDLLDTRQVRVADLEQLTGLDFGPLAACDTFDDDAAQAEDAEAAEDDPSDEEALRRASRGRSRKRPPRGGPVGNVGEWEGFSSSRQLPDGTSSRRTLWQAERDGGLSASSAIDIRIETSAAHPRFFFGEREEIELEAGGADQVRTAKIKRAGNDASIPFRIRVFASRGAAMRIVIQREGVEVYRRALTVDSDTFTLRDTIPVASSAAP